VLLTWQFAMLAAAPGDAIALLPQTSPTAAPPAGWTTIGIVKTLDG
jgi:hypothetical protein